MDVTLKDNIKFNCDVSDAAYWGYFSICGLLLRYRDLYRSELGLKPWADISRKDIAAWIDAKEAQWPDLENKDFRELTIDGKSYQPFEVEAINEALHPQGLVYGAGYSMYMKPTFFLAELTSTTRADGVTVHTSGRELVRDLLTAPAMLQGNTVFLRHEPLLVLLHFKLTELITRRNPALEAAFAQYGFRHLQLMDETLEHRLGDLATKYSRIILAHEMAEFKEGVPEWKDILTAAGDRKNEHYLRALKDLIADTSESGPLKGIIDTRDTAGLALSVAFLDGFHRVLFPEIRTAHAEFVNYNNWDLIEKTRKEAYDRFIREREKILELYRTSGGPEEFSKQLRKLIAV